MRRSLKVAAMFALAAALIDVIVACFVLDTYRHLPLPTFVKVLFDVGFWPSVLSERAGSIVARIDALFLSMFAWGLIGFILASVWRKLFAHGT
jgi:hypothetical protein